jgi:hypothetical protein
MQVSVCLVPFMNSKRFIKLFELVQKAEKIDFEIIVINNNNSPTYKWISEKPGMKYYHNENKGQLAGAVNKAVSMAEAEFFVYLCTNHIRIFSNDWLYYMVGQIKKYDERYVMGGDVRAFRNANHVQGGLYIARTEWLREHPYSKEFPFQFMDVEICKKIIKNEKKMFRIPLVHSSMGLWNRRSHDTNRMTKRIKIVHSSTINKFAY